MYVVKVSPSQIRFSSSARASYKETANYSSSQGYTTNNGNSHHPFFGDLVINQLAQTSRLKVLRLVVKQQLIIFAGFCVVA